MNIKELIPQRFPFLFIDKILHLNAESIEVEMIFNKDMDFFKGHFPTDPIVPGVILTEHCLQSGAALISSKFKDTLSQQLAVVSRINNAKFKQIIRPDEVIHTTTVLVDQLENAAYFKSTVKNLQNKKVLTLDFTCNLISKD